MVMEVVSSFMSALKTTRVLALVGCHKDSAVRVSTPQQKPASGPEEDQASLGRGRKSKTCRVRPGGDGQGFAAGADAAFRKLG